MGTGELEGASQYFALCKAGHSSGNRVQFVEIAEPVTEMPDGNGDRDRNRERNQQVGIDNLFLRIDI